jgi:hypothetical protein
MNHFQLLQEKDSLALCYLLKWGWCGQDIVLESPRLGLSLNDVAWGKYTPRILPFLDGSLIELYDSFTKAEPSKYRFAVFMVYQVKARQRFL